MTGAWLMFGVLALVLLFSGWKVVRTDDLVHSVLWLAVLLVATGVLYVTLHADFLAAAQLLLYTGGVVTLMLFGVMLTERLTGSRILHDSRDEGRAALVGGVVVGLVGLALSRSDLALQASDAPAHPADTQALGASFLVDHLLAFEVLSILLLAVMVAAITLARSTDP
ncbi:MAG: NADH-quinone oxidoreductase subunit J [Myxococcota bacterium]|jgi:NADH-quinone oxidoreductase subunit J|nr:NADH-quinone oxidoreductase subunit J [Myxococcota bacterium]